MADEFYAWPGAAFAVVSAILFGASTPLAKLLLRDGLDAQLLAGLFYLGSGLGLGFVLLVRGALAKSTRQPRAEAALRRADVPLLCLAVLLGGVVAPVLMMSGLARTSAASASLLQNLEGLATMAIAWVAFRENVDRRLLVGALAILAGAVLLSWTGPPGHAAGAGLAAGRGAGAASGLTAAASPAASPLGLGATAWGALLIAGACVAWGADNNLTRPLAHADPMQIAAIKGLVAGGVNVTLALSVGHAALPPLPTALAAGIVGLLAYGVSLVLYVLGLRHLGAARTAAYFSTAPFIGSALAVLLLDEPISTRLIGAGVLMAVGLYLHLRERHEHSHHHPVTEHAHRHVHDEHHRHAHGPADPPGEPHSHWHRHEPLTHTHPHYPDLHHRHEH